MTDQNILFRVYVFVECKWILAISLLVVTVSSLSISLVDQLMSM